VYVVYRGHGRSVVGGIAMDWGPGDVFVVPSWASLDHEAMDGPADLFAISDRPVLNALRIYREETLAEHQEARDTFQPALA
jgi:gentisate 1,2-dioxygenase